MARVQKPSGMARYVYVVKAFSARDGGWVRYGHLNHCPSEAAAWDMVAFLEPLAELSGDYSGFRVIKTVAFRRSAKSSGEEHNKFFQEAVGASTESTLTMGL